MPYSIIISESAEVDVREAAQLEDENQEVFWIFSVAGVGVNVL